MKKKSCKNCFFNYCCNSNVACDDYIPDIKDSEDDAYGTVIEKRRHDYYNEWYTYIDENSESHE